MTAKIKVADSMVNATANSGEASVSASGVWLRRSSTKRLMSHTLALGV